MTDRRWTLPTTSPEFALRALQALDSVHARYAILHGRDKLELSDISDVDITVFIHPTEIINVARSAWINLGLFPVVVCPYDIGGSHAVFLASEDGREGVQLDMLFDPDGMGRYGLRSKALVESAGPGPVPLVGEPERLIYLWRKRVAKHQYQNLERLSAEASAIGEATLTRASIGLTGSTATAESMLSGHIMGSGVSRIHHPWERSKRLAGRALRPVGFWAHVADRNIASELADRLGRFLVITRSGEVPSPLLQSWWHATTVWPTVVRPGGFLSYGRTPRWCLSPHMVAAEGRADELARQLIAAMTARIFA